MDIFTQSEIVLRRAGYDTWSWSGAPPSVVCFENLSVVGFIHVFVTADALLAKWQSDQEAVLARNAPALRGAGTKAWNVYSVFMTDEQAPARQSAIDRIEEDFSLTRKIARIAVRTADDVERALLPLVGVKAQPVLGDAQFESRLRNRLKDFSDDAISAFLGPISPDEVARILGDRP